MYCVNCTVNSELITAHNFLVFEVILETKRYCIEKNGRKITKNCEALKECSRKIKGGTAKNKRICSLLILLLSFASKEKIIKNYSYRRTQRPYKFRKLKNSFRILKKSIVIQTNHSRYCNQQISIIFRSIRI